MKRIFNNIISRRQRRKNNQNNKKTSDTQLLQNIQNAVNSPSNMSVLSELPPHGVQGRINIQLAGGEPSSAIHANAANNQSLQAPQQSQGDQSPGIGNQLADEVQSSAYPNVGNKVLQITGTVLEKSLKTLRGYASLIPAPGLGPALEIVCGCIEVYHVSNLLMATSS